MAQSIQESRRNGTWIFLLLTALITLPFNFLVLKSGHLMSANGMYVFGLCWGPALAAIFTIKIQGRHFSELGWSFGNRKYLVYSYLVPLSYTFITYLVIWATGLGGFYNQETVSKWTIDFGLGELVPWLAITFNFILMGTIGVIMTVTYSLGEEIGWRGFLVPELYKKVSYTKTSLISGVVWSVYHYPALIFADYNSGTPVWYGLTCFTIMIISSCFIYTWFRLKSTNLWTGVILHASHNVFIQGFFTPLTVDTGNTKYMIDEFGAGLSIVSIAFGLYFWTRRHELPARQIIE